MIKYLSVLALCLLLINCKKEAEKIDTVQPVEEEVVSENQTEIEDITSVEVDSMSSAAPNYMNLDLLGTDKNFNLNELHGEVVFLNHWGSWCGPCRMEMPSIQELYNAYGEKVKFVMIATERRQGAHLQYIEKEGFTFPVYTMNSPASTEIKAKGYPTTVILDKTGKVRTYDVGAANWNAPEVHDFLNKLLAE